MGGESGFFGVLDLLECLLLLFGLLLPRRHGSCWHMQVAEFVDPRAGGKLRLWLMF